MTAIADEKYVQLTTFTKDGRRKETPVWIADLGNGKVGFTTDTHTWKVKRINHTPTVELIAPNSRDKVKDGVQYRVINLGSKITKRIERDDDPGVGIVITLD